MRDAMQMDIEGKKWALYSTGSAIIAALTVRAFMRKGWQKATHRNPPINPASADASWASALIWGALSGLAVGLARTVARRGATTIWHRQEGRKAPVE